MDRHKIGKNISQKIYSELLYFTRVHLTHNACLRKVSASGRALVLGHFSFRCECLQLTQEAFLAHDACPSGFTSGSD